MRARIIAARTVAEALAAMAAALKPGSPTTGRPSPPGRRSRNSRALEEDLASLAGLSRPGAATRPG